MDGSFLIVSVAVVGVILTLVITAAVGPSRSGRHKGAYVPAKDRTTYTDATNHSAITDAVGPRSKRFPDLER
jgi:hypothetical protein